MGQMSKLEWEAHQERKREIEAQNIFDAKYQTRPLGQAPLVDMAPLKKFKREDVVEKAKKHAVNIWTRPSHKKSDYD